MLRRVLFLELSLAAAAAFGVACRSSDDEATKVEFQPGPGLPPGTVVLPLPEFEDETETVEIPNAVGFLEAELLGEGDTAIVIVNGGPGLNSAFVERLHQGMTEKLPGRRIVRYDQRGLGGSTPTTADQNTIAGAIEDLESIRRFLRVDKLHLVGQSFGGFVSGAYASTHSQNVASIAFIDPSPPLPADSEFNTKADAAMETHYQALVDAGILEPGSDDDPPGVAWNRGVGIYFVDPLVIPIELTAPTTEASFVINEAVDADYRANGAQLVETVDLLRIPVLVIGGGNSGFGRHLADGAAAALERAEPQVVIIEGAGHFPWFEQPEKTLGALETFFNDYAPRQ